MNCVLIDIVPTQCDIIYLCKYMQFKFTSRTLQCTFHRTHVTLSVKTRLKSNSEITSIKVWLQTFISLWFQSLTWPYSVNIKDAKNIFSSNVLYNMYDDFMQKNVNFEKMHLAGFFTERVTYTFALNWNHGGISCDVHFAGHLRLNRTNVWTDKRNIQSVFPPYLFTSLLLWSDSFILTQLWMKVILKY